MKTKRDYLEMIFIEARRNGLCKRQNDFAALLEINPGTLSKALQGDERYLTDNLFRRAKLWAKENGLDQEPEPVKPKEPDITIPAATAALYNNMSETIRIQAEIIARLQGAASVTHTAGAYTAPKNWTTEKG